MSVTMTECAFAWEDIRKHDKENDAWVVMNDEIFDISKFLKEHPGGSTIVLPHIGTDISQIFMDDDVHAHSKSAHEMMKRYKIGHVIGTRATKTSQTETAVSKPSIDFSKPIIFQVGRLGTDYVDFIHTPQVLDEPARFFEWDFMEFFSRTPWYVVPMFWLPVITYLDFHCLTDLDMTPAAVAFLFVAGIGVWTLIEYLLHRFIFHLDEKMQGSYWTITLHFLLHGVHHLLPMDPMRLVMPPPLAIAIAIPIVFFLRLFLAYETTVGLLAGGLTGYVMYDLIHYYLHHSDRPFLSYFADLKSYHLAHHYKTYKLGYGITSKAWDFVFGTVLPLDRPAVKTAKAA